MLLLVLPLIACLPPGRCESCYLYDIMTENELSPIIRGAIFKVYNALGPGLLESVYVAALVYELKKAGLIVRTEVPLPVIYEEEKLDLGFSPAFSALAST